MAGSRRGKKLLWRWRSNPLRRHEDVLEAWVVLAVWAVMVIGGSLAGFLTAQAAQEVFADQRAQRRSVPAVLLADVPEPGSGPYSTGDRSSAEVRWNAPDGTRRTGRTLVEGGRKADAQVTVWIDGTGALTSEPPTQNEAAIEAGALGTAAALSLSGLTYGVGRAGRWWLDRRRVEQWGREWTLVGPRWGHKTS
ncbi:Rv1733c family protein [Streptomyces neyagawaensis]|uniref:Rv1733c family protein n=1 Tax=Streptomyces neyagawaensis TaxID=42238 RepID=UPI0006E3EA18|nr:hypothetical protein [Streptomyces neyagawaensis]MCL6735983.1 hypothetical protein [Streptomyces neyagawaensis]MDE1686901.1 hypothetical protein [Streptomyces neyagawaensis]